MNKLPPLTLASTSIHGTFHPLGTMKYLLIVLCLALAGCATHKHSHAKPAADFQAAMQKVLDQRNDIRQIISHPPRTQAELDGPAQGNPNALIFNVQDFAQRLQTIPLTGCPYDFKTAFGNYVAAWQERAAQNPAAQLLNNPGTAVPASATPSAAGQTEAAWQNVLSVQASYSAKLPAKDF
jgi:hypothetical protein